MRPVRVWVARVCGFVNGARADSELAEELESHLEMQIEDNIRRGMTPADARRQALIRLGSIESAKERYRDRRGIPPLEHLVQDVRYGLRVLRRTPAFTATAVLTLAIGIGANTAVFSLWNQALLEPLPVASADELVEVQLASPSGARFNNLQYPEFGVLGAERRVFSNALLYGRRSLNVRVAGQWLSANADLVSGSYYATLGVNAIAGRTITLADERARDRVAVLSFSFWSRRFGQDRAVIGNTIAIDGLPFTIIGVTPASFFGVDRLRPPDIAIPMTAAAQPGTVWCIGRLRPGVSLDQARAALTGGLAGVLDQQRPRIKDWSPSEQENFLGLKADVRRVGRGNWGLELMLARALPLVTAAFAVLLLIGCVNIANLLHARALARHVEITTRLALGAGRWRVFRQCLTENLLLACAGGGLGLVVALMVHPLFVALLPIAPDATMRFTLDVRILAFAAATSLLAGILFGTMPALRMSAVDGYDVMKRATVAGHRHLRPTRTLLAFQVGASIVLLVAATLLVRTLRNLQAMDGGFDRDHILLMAVDPVHSRYRGAGRIDLYEQLTARVRQIPGIRSAALASVALFGAAAQKTIWVGGYQYAPHENQVTAFNEVGPGFLSTTRIHLVKGRDFTVDDRPGAPRVALVNETFARKYFPGRNPLGRRFGDRGPASAETYEIVGVVSDAKYSDLREPPRPAVFQPLWQGTGDYRVVLHVETAPEPASLAEQVRRVVQSVDNDLIVSDTRTMTQQVRDTLHMQRAFALLSTLVGAIALLLTSVGLYGVTGYSVTQRTREIGTRMALGAQPADILRMVLRETCGVVIAGLAIAIPAALAVSHILRSALFGLSPEDPGAMATATLLVFAVVALAAYVPARRAARVVPMTALRYE